MNVDEENVNVVVRIRPMQAHEKKNGDVPCVKAEKSGKEVQVKVGPLDAQVYRCHRCFNAETSQSDFFIECGITDLLDSAMDGYRACAFAFGQTGAGKTFTMVGATKGISHKDKQVGLIARSLEYLYMKLNGTGIKYRLRLSCLEIYHEHVYDLFADEKERLPLAVREHATEGFFLEGSRLVECKDYEVACAALDVAVKNRQVGGHDLNSRSSRSHCMTEIYIDTGSREGYEDDDRAEHYLNRGKMTLVDLAGSERLKNTNSTGKVLQEAGFINRSLYVLGKVIAGLVRTNGDLNHKDVPFRDSKLTKLLISSLGGNSRTVLIACVSEAKGSQAETLRTLKFSMSCARIRNKPVKFLDPQEKLIIDLKDEIRRLRHENKRLRSTILTAPTSTTDSIDDHFAPMDEPNSPMKRASSANGFEDRARQYGYRNSKQSLVSNNKKKKQVTKPKKKQPEIFYKYPQLQSVLKDDGKKNKNVRDASDNRSVQSNMSHQSRQKGAPRSQGPSAALLLESDAEYANEDMRSVGSSSKHKISMEILDEVIHRKAGGPMVFKDKDSPIPSLRDTRLNQYYPAENYIRAMDAAKEEVLDPPKAQAPPVTEQANISVDGLQFVKKKSKPKKAPQWKAEKKPSPYLVPLLKNEKVKKDKSKDALPQIKQPSHMNGKVVAEPSETEEERQELLAQLDAIDSHHSKPEKKLVKKVEKPSGRKNPPRQAAAVENHSSLPVLPAISPRPAQQQAPSKNNVVPVAKLPKMKISDIPSDNELRNVLKASMTEPILKTVKPETNSGESVNHTVEPAIPAVEVSPIPDKCNHSSPQKGENNTSNEKEPIVSPKITIEVEEDQDDYGYEFDEEGDKRNNEVKHEVSTPERLTKKLEQLEKSLLIKRMEMEDSPGHVTSEVEERFKHLKLEAKAIRVELAAITGEISPTKLVKDDEEDNQYGDDDFMEDDDAEEKPLASPPKDRNESPSKQVSSPLKLQPSSPTLGDDQAAQKLWFLRENQKPQAANDVVENVPSKSLERSASDKKFVELIGKPYHEEFHELTQKISSPSKPGVSPVTKSNNTSPAKTVEVANEDEKNDYGDDDFDGFEEDDDDGDKPSNPAKTLNPSSQSAQFGLPLSVDAPTKSLNPVSPDKEEPVKIPIASSPTKAIDSLKQQNEPDDYGEEEFDNYDEEFEVGEDE